MSRDPSVHTTITSIGLFSGCTRTEHSLIEQLATVVEVDESTVLCAEGEIGQTFYVLARGEVLVEVDGHEIARLGPGCGFGEIALLRPGGRRIATVTTATSCQLVLFSRPEFATLMAEAPRLAHDLAAESRRRLEPRGGGSGPFATS